MNRSRSLSRLSKIPRRSSTSPSLKSSGGRSSSTDNGLNRGSLGLKSDRGRATRSNVSKGQPKSSLGGPQKLSIGGQQKSSMGVQQKLSFGFGHGQNKLRSSSSYGLLPQSGISKDPRNLHDGSVKRNMIKNLIEFLTSNGYDSRLSIKILNSPSVQEFRNIFEFMLKFICPEYTLHKKSHVDEFPQRLKSLGYPFNLSRSTMSALGSLHAWPLILGALSWLQELILFGMSTNVDNIMFPVEFDGKSEHQMLMEHVVNLYTTKYMKGEDSFDEEKAEFAKAIKLKNNIDDMDELESENKRLVQTLETLTNSFDSISVLKEELCQTENNLREFDSYLNEREIHLKKQTNKLNTIQKEIQSAEFELANADELLKSKQVAVDNQELTATDVQRMRTDNYEVSCQIEHKEGEMRKIDDEIWNQEVVLSKINKKFESELNEHNKTLRLLHMIPETAKYANGFDLKLTADECRCDEIRPKLEEISNLWKDKIYNLDSKITSQNERLEQATEMNVQKQKALECLKLNVKRKKDAMDSIKTDNDKKVYDLKLQLTESQENNENDLKKLLTNLDNPVDNSLKKDEIELLLKQAKERLQTNQENRLLECRSKRAHSEAVLEECMNQIAKLKNIEERKLKELAECSKKKKRNNVIPV